MQNTPMHFVQLTHPQQGRRTAIVEESKLQLLTTYHTLYDLANDAIARGLGLGSLAHGYRGSEALSYDEIYDGQSEWQLLPPFDHPHEIARCLVTGTGLTHKASAENRAKMHQQQPSVITDSMHMYRWGLEGGSPAEGECGVQPEWFYKGNGSVLRGHNQALTIPQFADDGGEEPEVAGVYLIGANGTPYRIGLVTGNEFSDHKMERKNYLYLAPSKLRECAIGPELVTDLVFDTIEGRVSIERNSEAAWAAAIFTGEKNMSHTIANLEHHHFKYPEHRRPGDVHIHFFGADAFSFGAGFELIEGDTMVVSWPPLGRPLRNPLRVEQKIDAPVKAAPVKVAML
jgi:hypothetical protein